MRHPYMLSATCFIAALFSMPAAAYIGLGPGMTMIGSFFSLILAVLVVLLMVLVLPIRMLLKRRKQRRSKPDDSHTTPDGTA
jgi:membrane protein implicated in regulation of membrane protease activity